jgi:hypothetical protein
MIEQSHQDPQTGLHYLQLLPQSFIYMTLVNAGKISPSSRTTGFPLWYRKPQHR